MSVGKTLQVLVLAYVMASDSEEVELTECALLDFQEELGLGICTREDFRFTWRLFRRCIRENADDLPRWEKQVVADILATA